MDALTACRLRGKLGVCRVSRVTLGLLGYSIEMKEAYSLDKKNTDRIEHFMMEIVESEQYREVAYLVSSIRKYFLHYLTHFRTKNFPVPSFLTDIVEYVGNRFIASDISPTCMLEYMNDNDVGNWVHYYDDVFLRPYDKGTESGAFECDKTFFMLILTGFILDTFRNNNDDLRTIVKNERLEYEANQYGLTIVNGVRFERDYFIFDKKAYLYSIFTNTSVIEIFDQMPGFARIITENVKDGDVLLRLDERLAVPEEQAISYSTLNAEKFYGPQFHFKDSRLINVKTVTVHIDNESSDKLLMVIKQDYDTVRKEEFMHIEIETLPFVQDCLPDKPCITTFIHGMYYPSNDCFSHIDYAKNQYAFKDYDMKYREVSSDFPVDFYADKQLHHKIWCLENGNFSREVWYQLMVASLSERYRTLLDEILA